MSGSDDRPRRPSASDADDTRPAPAVSNRYGIPYLRDPTGLDGVCAVRDVDLNTIESFGRVARAYDSPSQTGVLQRPFLFGLVTARRPRRILELGFRYGATSLVMLCALEDVGGEGKLVALDPAPEPMLDFSRFGERFSLYQGSSPRDVVGAARELGGPVKLCHIDADHRVEAVSADLEAVRPHMAPESYVLLYDGCWPDVARAIRAFVKRHARDVVDCGLIDPFANDEGWSRMHRLRCL